MPCTPRLTSILVLLNRENDTSDKVAGARIVPRLVMDGGRSVGKWMVQTKNPQELQVCCWLRCQKKETKGFASFYYHSAVSLSVYVLLVRAFFFEL